MTQRVPFAILVSWVVLALMALMSGGAFGQDNKNKDLKNPRMQQAVQSIEQAQAYLDQAARNAPQEARQQLEQARQILHEANAEIGQALVAVGNDRTIDRGQAEPTERPVQAARQAAEQARASLKGADGNYKGHEKKAMEQVDAAIARMEPLVQQEPQWVGNARNNNDQGVQSRNDNQNDDRDAQTNDERHEAFLKDLPNPVRQTLRTNTPNVRIRELRRDGGSGQQGVVYKIEGTDADKSDVEMEIAENGDVLKLERRDENARPEDARHEAFLRDLPAPVRETLRTNTPNLRIRELNRDGQQNDAVYRMVGVDADNNRVEMDVAANGDVRKLERGPETNLSRDQRHEAFLKDLPNPVRETLRTNTPNLRISELRRDGQQDDAVYRMVGVDADNNRVEMDVAANGDVRKLERGGETNQTRTDN